MKVIWSSSASAASRNPATEANRPSRPAVTPDSSVNRLVNRPPWESVNELTCPHRGVRHRALPLLGGAEDDGFLGAPVVGILVAVGLVQNEGAAVPQALDARHVAVAQHVLALEVGAGIRCEIAFVVDRRTQGKIKLEARDVIL